MLHGQIYLGASVGVNDKPPTVYFAVRAFAEQALIDNPVRLDEAAIHCARPRRAPAITCNLWIYLQHGHLTSDLGNCIV